MVKWTFAELNAKIEFWLAFATTVFIVAYCCCQYLLPNCDPRDRRKKPSFFCFLNGSLFYKTYQDTKDVFGPEDWPKDPEMDTKDIEGFVEQIEQLWDKSSDQTVFRALMRWMAPWYAFVHVWQGSLRICDLVAPITIAWIPMYIDTPDAPMRLLVKFALMVITVKATQKMVYSMIEIILTLRGSDRICYGLQLMIVRKMHTMSAGTIMMTGVTADLAQECLQNARAIATNLVNSTLRTCAVDVGVGMYACYMLWLEHGVLVFVLGMTTSTFFGSIVSFAGAKSARIGAAIWVAGVERFNSLNYVLQKFRELRMYDWVDRFMEPLQKPRQKIMRSACGCCGVHFVSSLATSLISPSMSLISVALKLYRGEQVTVHSALLAYIYMAMITSSLTMLAALYGNIIDISYKAARIEYFLRLPTCAGEPVLPGPLRLENASFEVELPKPADEKPQEQKKKGAESRKETIKFEVLKDVSLSLNKGELTIITGAIGSGKTTFLSCLVGEIKCKSGKQWLPKQSMAIQTQVPQLLDGTIRHNILFGIPAEECNEEYLWRALEASQLAQEMRNPKSTLYLMKEQTQVGKQGSQLSGGQRARVSLARSTYAVLSGVSSAVLDDPCASVDNEVVNNIWQDTVLEEMKDVTRVICVNTQLLERLAPTADNLVVMQGMNIVFKGTIAEAVEKEKEINQALNGEFKLDGKWVPIKRTSEASFSDQSPAEKAGTLIDRLHRACTREEIQKDLDKLQKSKGTVLASNLDQLLGRAAATVAKGLSLSDDYNMAKIKDLVKEHSTDLAIRQQSRVVEKLLRLEPDALFETPEVKEEVASCDAQVTSPTLANPEIKYDEHGVPILDVDQVLKLQEDLKQSFSHTEFQQKLQEIVSRFQNNVAVLDKARTELLMTVYEIVLPKYGFEASSKGVLQMMAAVQHIGCDERIMKNDYEIKTELLKMQDLTKDQAETAVANLIRSCKPLMQFAYSEENGKSLELSPSEWEMLRQRLRDLQRSCKLETPQPGERLPIWKVSLKLFCSTWGIPLLSLIFKFCKIFEYPHKFAVFRHLELHDSDWSDNKLMSYLAVLSIWYAALDPLPALTDGLSRCLVANYLSGALDAKVSKLAMSYFWTAGTGSEEKFRKLLQMDTSSLSGLFSLPLGLMLIIINLCYISRHKPLLAIISLIGSSIIYKHIVNIYTWQTTKLHVALIEIMTRLDTNVGNQFQTLSMIRAFKREKRFEKSLHSAMMVGCYWNTLHRSSMLAIEIMSTCCNCMFVFMACVLIQQVKQNSMDASLGTLFWVLTQSIEGHIANAMGQYQPWQDCKYRWRELETLFTTPWSEDPNAGDEAPEGWPAKGSVAFEEVTFRYAPGAPEAIKGFTIEVNPGEKVGVVGKTGSGKSTLAMLLLRLGPIKGMPPSSGGRVLIDGIDIATLKLPVLRRTVVIVPQEPTIFEQWTLHENIGKEYSEEEVLKAISTCSLDAKQLTNTAEDSKALASHLTAITTGQSQLLMVARALVRNPTVMILDECTASMDRETADQLLETMTSKIRDTTVFSIAHRLRFVLKSDRIMVLGHQAQVLGFDTPEKLLEDKDSYFSVNLRLEEQE